MNVQFDLNDASLNVPSRKAVPKRRRMIELVMKTGLAKDEEQANYALLGVSILFFIIAIVVALNI